MGHIANEINNLVVTNNMKLNPGKCKEMRISFVMIVVSGSLLQLEARVLKQVSPLSYSTFISLRIFLGQFILIM